MVTAPYFTLIGLLTLVFASNVIRLRRQNRIGLGDGGNQELLRAGRVFGNFIEYAPLGLVLLVGLEMAQAPAWYMHLSGSTLLVGRIAHSIGLSQSSGYSLGRTYGMILTLTSIGISAIGVSVFGLILPP